MVYCPTSEHFENIDINAIRRKMGMQSGVCVCFLAGSSNCCMCHAAKHSEHCSGELLHFRFTCPASKQVNSVPYCCHRGCNSRTRACSGSLQLRPCACACVIGIRFCRHRNSGLQLSTKQVDAVVRYCNSVTTASPRSIAMLLKTLPQHLGGR